MKLIFAMLTIALLSSFFGFSQKRTPDGSIIYPDGRRLLPNGTMVYPGGTIQKKGETVRLPDGTVVYPDGSRHKQGSVLFPVPTAQRPVTHRRGWIPPGQAKKMYGTKSAKPFAPGQQKKWKDGHGNDNDNGHGHGKKGGGKDKD